jgi:hypothetical protein
MKRIFNQDMKHYKAEEGPMLIKSATWLVFVLIFVAVAYISEADYQECLAGNQSIVLCGGGNTK